MGTTTRSEDVIHLWSPRFEQLTARQQHQAREWAFQLGQEWARRTLLDLLDTPPEELPAWEFVEMLRVEFGDQLPDQQLERWQTRVETSDEPTDPRIAAFQAASFLLQARYRAYLKQNRQVLAQFLQANEEAIELLGLGPLGQLILEAGDRSFVVAHRDRVRQFARGELVELLQVWQEELRDGSRETTPLEMKRALALHEAFQQAETGREDELSVVDPLLEHLEHAEELAVASLADNAATHMFGEYRIIELLEPRL